MICFTNRIAPWPLLLAASVSILILGHNCAADTSAQTDVFAQIDRMHRDGSITDDQRSLYRVAAVRAPQLLPDRLRSLEVRGTGPVNSKSFVMFEAFQQLQQMDPEGRDLLQPLLNPPSGYAYYLEMTDPFPMRVFYNQSSYENEAQAMLDAAAFSYAKEVEDWGFWEPPIDPDYGYYPAYIDNAGGAGAYTAPYADNPATSHADAFSYIVMDSGNDMSSIPVIWAHEYNHACQASVDVWERWAFYEATATYIMSQVYPSDWYYTEYFIPSFQGLPHKALDWQDYDGAGAGYVYGASLWVIFLEYMYAEDDPSWIADIWADCDQADGMANEPDYFDAVAQAMGGSAGFEEMFLDFARYRYFVGFDSDGQHLPGSQNWGGSEVAKEASWSSIHLPIVEESPSIGTAPEQNGCNYIELALTNDDYADVSIHFSGQTGLKWNVDVMNVAAGSEPPVETMTLGTDNQGDLSVATSQGDLLVLVICQLGKANYDPDYEAWSAGDYTYSIVPGEVQVPAQIEAVSPDTLTQGAADVLLTIGGTGFVDHDNLGAGVSGAGVVVSNVTFVSETTITCTASVDEDADVGARNVLVSLPDGEQLTGFGMLTIEQSISNESSSAEDNCGCSTVGTASVGFHSLVKVLLSVF